MSNWIPSKNADFVAFLHNFAQAALTYTATSGLSSGETSALQTIDTDTAAVWATMNDPAQRTPMVIADFNFDRTTAETQLKNAMAKIQAANGTNTTMLTAFGLTIRKTTRTPVATPTEVPDLSIQAISTGQITLRAKVLGAVGSAKPNGATSTRFYRRTYSGSPSVPGTWMYIGNLTKRFFIDDVSGLEPGTKVDYKAFFATTTGLIGPESSVITANVSA